MFWEQMYCSQCSISGVLPLTWYTSSRNTICEVLVASFQKKRRLVWRSENNLLTFPLNSSYLHSWWKYFLFLSSFCTEVKVDGATNVAFCVHRLCCTAAVGFSGISRCEAVRSRNYGLRTQTGRLIHSFIHSVFCLTTGPKPPPKRFLHIVRSRASFFKWEYPLRSLRSTSNFLRLLPRLLATSISPFIFPSITCFRRQFLRKMWPIQLAFRFLISCRIFLCLLTLSNTSSFLTWSVQLIFSIITKFNITEKSSWL